MAHRKKAPEEPGPKEKAGDDIAKRLARIAGHAASLKRLWEEDREADEVLTQIAAVRAALDEAGKAILKRRIEDSFAEAGDDAGDRDKTVRALKKSLDRLMS